MAVSNETMVEVWPALFGMPFLQHSALLAESWLDLVLKCQLRFDIDVETLLRLQGLLASAPDSYGVNVDSGVLSQFHDTDIACRKGGWIRN